MKRLRLKLIIGMLILSGINVSAQTDFYKQALDEICDMLNDKKPLDFKRAVFLTENAYYNGQLNYTEFCDEIDRIKIILTKMIEAKGLQKYKTAGHWAIFSYMTEKIPENDYSPYLYDFDNFMGDKDYESFMVASLLKNKKGNCHSLPYLYKILAEEINVEAFIALAPMHVFIKHKDEKEQWWNLELTSGTFSRTSFIIESFNVSDVGMQSGLYMKPLNEKESIALCLSDMIEYFYHKHNNIPNDFTQRCYETGLKYYPNSLLQLYKLDYIKFRLDESMKEKGLSDYKKINPYPELVKKYNEMKKAESDISEIGYTTLTLEQYREKVMQINSQKEDMRKTK